MNGQNFTTSRSTKLRKKPSLPSLMFVDGGQKKLKVARTNSVMSLLTVRTQLNEPWTVARLARAVGMSRTLFVARFDSLVGQPPIRFLTRLRLTQAAGQLTTTDETLYAIARRSGYDTEASFSKAFKREFSVSPGAYRRQSVERPVGIDRQARRA